MNENAANQHPLWPFQSESEVRNGVHFLSEFRPFEAYYIAVRDKEERVYDDALLKKLPLISSGHRYAGEWKLRKKSLDRLLGHLRSHAKPLTIVEVGAGNGWLSNHLSQIEQAQVVGLDVNQLELEQGARVFNQPNLAFAFGDIFAPIVKPASVDVIVLAASFQYFPDPIAALKQLAGWLKEDGELHVLDTPFYGKGEGQAAQQRSLRYYTEMGCPEMADHYYHHEWDQLNPLSYEVLYQPATGGSRILRKLKAKDSPFPWIRFKAIDLPSS